MKKKRISGNQQRKKTVKTAKHDSVTRFWSFFPGIEQVETTWHYLCLKKNENLGSFGACCTICSLYGHKQSAWTWKELSACQRETRSRPRGRTKEASCGRLCKRRCDPTKRTSHKKKLQNKNKAHSLYRKKEPLTQPNRPKIRPSDFFKENTIITYLSIVLREVKSFDKALKRSVRCRNLRYF